MVDNGSTDGTRRVRDRYASRYPDIVKPAEEPDKIGSYAARNRGIEVASGTICSFIDADMIVRPRWIENISSVFRGRSIDYLGTRVKLMDSHSTLVSRYESMNGFQVRERLEQKQYVPTCCLSLTRDVVEEVGLFDGELISGGDREFGTRVHEAGFRMGYEGDIVMYHPSRRRLMDLYGKYFRIGRGMYQLSFRHPDRFGQLNVDSTDPETYLPTLPHVFVREQSGKTAWKRAGNGERICYYVMNWLEQLVKRVGYLMEKGEPSVEGIGDSGT